MRGDIMPTGNYPGGRDPLVVKVDNSKVEAALAGLRAESIPKFRMDTGRDLALEALHTMTPLVPVAYRVWRRGYRRGLLRKSTMMRETRDGYFVGTTRYYGPYVKAGVRWRGEPSMPGPRPYDVWTYRELREKAPAIMLRNANAIKVAWGAM